MKRPFQSAGMRRSKPTCGRTWPKTRQCAGACGVSGSDWATATVIWLLVRLRRSAQTVTGLFWAQRTPAAANRQLMPPDQAGQGMTSMLAALTKGGGDMGGIGAELLGLKTSGDRSEERRVGKE